MKPSDLKVGAKVICVFDGKYKGKVGIISRVLSNGDYFVKDENGDFIGGSSWSRISSFELLENSPISLSDAVASKEDLIDSIVEEKKPCPRSYYGLEECICNMCPPLRKRNW